MASHAILAIGDGYLSAGDMARTLEPLGLEFPVTYRAVDPDARPRLAGVREYQGDPEVISGWLTGEDILLVHAAPVTDDLLAAHPEVHVVACARGGAVNVDLSAAKRHGVVVINTPAKNAPSVADLTMTSIQQLFRRSHQANRWVIENAARGETAIDSTFSGAMWLGMEPHGHTLGVVGFGAIGRLVSRQAVAAGMSVLASDPFAEPSGGAEFVPLDELLERSDVVTLHAPAIAETRGIADEAFFARMRRGAFFINTARESLVIEGALLAALESGHLAGAALDVFEPDGLWPELASLPQVIVTPHLGGATRQTQQRALRMLVDDLRRWAGGEDPVHRVA